MHQYNFNTKQRGLISESTTQSILSVAIEYKASMKKQTNQWFLCMSFCCFADNYVKMRKNILVL